MSRSPYKMTVRGLRLLGPAALALCLTVRVGLAPQPHFAQLREGRLTSPCSPVLEETTGDTDDGPVAPSLERPPGGPNVTSGPRRTSATMREKEAADPPGAFAPLAALPERSSRSAKAIEVLSRHRPAEGGPPGSRSMCRFRASRADIMAKTLLVLAAGPLQLPAITTAKRMGLRVVAADGNPDAPGLALADKSYVINILDPEACLLVAWREKIDGVIHICSEVSVYAMARVNEMLGLKGILPSTAIRATNKERMRRAFEAAGAPSPKSIGVVTEDEARAAAREIGWPLILKPSRNSGSRGVTMLTGREGDAAFLAALQLAISESRDASAVIEHYVEGPEFSIEILVWDGEPRVLALTDKVTTEAPHFVETGHSQPSRQPAAAQAAVLGAAVQGVKALGIDWAAAHAEVKLAPDGPYLMEIGARLGGDFITTELVPRSTGIDMVEGAIRLALGEVPDLRPRHAPQGASIRYLTPSPGTVTSVRGVERARAMPGVRIVEVDVQVGDTVAALTSSLARVGHVIAEGATAEEAIARAEAARDAIQIVTE